MNKIFKLFAIFTLLYGITSCAGNKANIDDEKFLTYYEKRGYNETPRYQETIDYSKMLANESSKVNYTSIGISPQGRDIPLLIVDKNGYTSPEKIRKAGRVIVLAEASIHSGEPDGKDAGLMFIRDIALFDKYPGILDNVSFLFIPIFNVDGHEDFGAHYRINQNGPEEVGARFTAQRYNLNRDFIKADAPEMRAFLDLYSKWMPELFIDFHVTNGADFQYVSTYGLDQCGFLTPNMLSWSQNVFEKQLLERMAADNYPIFPYFTMRNIPDFGVGILPDNFPPQYSNGYAGANNRIGLLVENHIYKSYKERVDASYLYMKHSMDILGENAKNLAEEIKKADEFAASAAFRKDSVALMFEHDMKSSVPTDYLAWKDTTVVSDLSGANWTYYDYNSPITLSYPLFTSYRPSAVVKVPEAYIIPAEQLKTIELLGAHSLIYYRLTEDKEIEVESYLFKNTEWARNTNEGHITLRTDYDTKVEKIKYHKGDVVVPTSQPRVKVALHLLEPKSPTSLVFWGYYINFMRAPNEFYVRVNYMETKGREMLAKDPELKKEFENKKASDPTFAKDPNAILQFFMAKVRESVEIGINRYPVGRIMHSEF